MKGKLKIAIITLVVLLAGTGAFLWKMNDISKKLTQKEQANLKEERDLLEEQNGKAIDQIKEVNIIPLYMDGNDKNVVTTQFNSIAEIYSTDKSAQVEKNLTDIKKNRSFTFDEPLWAYNPYGTNRNSMYVYFTTSGNCYCRYTISVKDENIPDFTRTAMTQTSGNVTKEHEYQIIGLVAGQTNYITMNLYNSDDELSDTNTFSVTIPASQTQSSNILTTTKGRSKTTISNGLYVVFQDGSKVAGAKKKATKNYAILLYDNSGILRAELPTNGYCGRNMEQVYDTLVYASSQTTISQINALGQVTKTFSLDGYKQDGEFTYDGYGNVYVIASENKKKVTPKSKVVEVELESGTVTEVLDMDTLLSSVYKKAVKQAKKSNVDWIGLNSIQVVGTNKLMLSSKNLSSIIKVSNVGSLLPNINYIIADKNIYKSYKSLSKKVLTKSSEEEEETAQETPAVNNILEKKVTPEPFESQYGQEAIVFQEKSAEGQFELTMLNSNSGNGANTNGESYYYRYLIDETTNTYQLQEKIPVDQTKNDGNILSLDSSYVYCCSDENIFVEMDQTGKLIKQFAATQRPYRVYKRDFKNFWFY